MPRKTDANNPADWLWMASSDLDVVRLAVNQQIGFTVCRSKLAEVLEKIMKAELIRLGWELESWNTKWPPPSHDIRVPILKMSA